MNLSSRRRARPEDLSAEAASDAIKTQVRKQLSTSLDATLGQSKDFEVNSTLKSYASSVAGTQTLREYEERRGAEERLEELRRAGLSEHEIGLYVEYGLDGSGSSVAAAKKPRRVATDEALEARLSTIQEKLTSKSGSKWAAWQLDLDDTQKQADGRKQASKATMVWKPPDEIMSGVANAGEAPTTDNNAFVPPKKSGKGLGASSLLPKWEPVKHVQPAGVVLRKTTAKVPEPVSVTREEIAVGRLSVDAIRQLPRFSSYEPGDASQTLYIKNLASGTSQADLLAVFAAAACGEQHLAAGPPDIRLMKKGKLRGQAFVTFPSLEAAKLALQAVNGYVLRNKPMVIQYGHSAGSEQAGAEQAQTSTLVRAEFLTGLRNVFY